MTSSIFRPRRSRAWPEPRTHLIESTMLVLPEPLGPTIAVTPPSNRISVGRANVLKPSSCSERRNKGRFTVADLDGVPAKSRRSLGFRGALCWTFRYHLSGLRLGYSIGSPNWRLGGGSAISGAASPEGSTDSGTGDSGAGSVGAGSDLLTAGRGWRGLRRALDRGGLTAVTGLSAPTRLSSAARAASCSASCLVAPCPVPNGSAPENTTDVYSRFDPTLAPSLS